MRINRFLFHVEAESDGLPSLEFSTNASISAMQSAVQSGPERPIAVVRQCSGCNVATILGAETKRQSWVSYCKRFIGTVPRRKVASTNGGPLPNRNYRRLRKRVSPPCGFFPPPQSRG